MQGLKNEYYPRMAMNLESWDKLNHDMIKKKELTVRSSKKRTRMKNELLADQYAMSIT